MEREDRGRAEGEGDEEEDEETGNLGLGVSVDLQRSLATLASQVRFSVCKVVSAEAAAAAGTTTGLCSRARISAAAGTTTGLCSRARISRFFGGRQPWLLSWLDFMVGFHSLFVSQVGFLNLLFLSLFVPISVSLSISIQFKGFIGMRNISLSQCCRGLYQVSFRSSLCDCVSWTQ